MLLSSAAIKRRCEKDGQEGCTFKSNLLNTVNVGCDTPQIMYHMSWHIILLPNGVVQTNAIRNGTDELQVPFDVERYI